MLIGDTVKKAIIRMLLDQSSRAVQQRMEKLISRNCLVDRLKVDNSMIHSLPLYVLLKASMTDIHDIINIWEHVMTT